jgi:hypothetical protein|tara:strand:- start:1364 stop:2677 length:1314 start_codon:yes stop_codon:yes gene_type:complete
MEIFMKYIRVFLFAGIIAFLSPYKSFANSQNTFNQLILAKSSLESRFNVQSVECFPFKENIGFTEDQIPLIKNCLAGVRLLTSALDSVVDPEIHTVGISTRFLRTGGFNTVLIPWNASLPETVAFLENRLSKEKQDLFLAKISTLKRKINLKLRIPSLYCSQRISNEQCMAGYESLSSVEMPPGAKPVRWKEIVLDDERGLGENSHSYRINYHASSEEMFAILLMDPQKEWSFRKRMYDDIKSKFKGAFEKRLQVATYFCSTELTVKNCLEGIASLSQASERQVMRMKAWGEVVIDEYNTFIKDDFDVSIRFDLPTDELVSYFSSKENRAEATKNAVLVEKLEKRTLNNPSGLRAVCDLDGMRSRLCVGAFKDFISFVSSHRDYRVKEPWESVMFIDGTQLARVNFALNSPPRHSYIYIDAASSAEELQTHLMRFGK